MKKIKIIAVIFFLFYFFSKVFSQGGFEKEEMRQAGDTYLKKAGKKPSDFSSENEKNIYLVRHLHEMEGYYSFSTGISKLKNKSPELMEALRERVLQCLLHLEINRNHHNRGILKALLENSSDLEREYLPFLEELAKGDSRLQTPKYLKKIAIEKIPDPGSLFDLSKKIQILANKYLLLIQPDHKDATNFFIHYPINKSNKKQSHYFTAQDNNWSGYGIVNEHGEWILPPFYEIGEGATIFHDGFAEVRVIPEYFKSNKAIYGNWIDPNGKFLLPYFVGNSRNFITGKARCEIDGKVKYLDRNGNFLDIPNPENLYFLKNGYAYRLENEKTYLLDDQGKILRTLDKKYWHIFLKPEDNLISYGSGNGWPGDGWFGYMNLQGNILTEPIYYTSSDYDFNSGSFDGKDIMVLSMEYQRVGLVNRQFQTLIPFSYDDIRIINQKYVVAKKGNGYSLFDHSGKMVAKKTPEWFKQGYYVIYDGPLGIAEKNDESYTIIDEDGQLVKELEHFEANALKHGFISLKKGKWGVLDYQFKEVLPFIYDRVFLISEEVILTELNNRFQCHNVHTGKIQDLGENLEIGKYGPDHNKEYMVVKMKGKSGIASLNGEIILPVEFQSIRPGWPIPK